MKNRISQRLIKHLNELRKRALKEKDEDKRSDYWWLYNDAKTIEPEIREMILKSENQTLLEMMSNYGLMPIILGGGIPLAGSDASRARLLLVHSEVHPSGIVSLAYDVQSAAG